MKVERYLAFSQSPEFIAESGIATLDRTKIVVCIHPDSSRAAFDLLDRCRPWTEESNVALEIDTRAVIADWH